MLRLKDVPETETAEVIRVAQELYERETSETRRRDSLVDAAEELGLPGEYLERAAHEVHQRRVAEVHQKRRKRNVLLGVTAGIALIGGLAFSTATLRRTPPQTPATISAPRVVDDFNVSPSRNWSLDTDGRSKGVVDYVEEAGRGQVARVRVESFRSDGQGRFFVNLYQSAPPGNLSGYRQFSFDARGSGLQRVRLDLENGPLERWRGPAVSVGEQWQTISVRLDQFERQVRSSPSATWQRSPGRAPADIRRLAFKTGERVNDASARGEIRLDNVRAE